MIADDDAETMESSIVQNQDKMTYWTNFDSWIDYVTLLFWVGGIAMIGMGMVGAANASSEEERRISQPLLKKPRLKKPRLKTASDVFTFHEGGKGRKTDLLSPTIGGRTYTDSNNRCTKRPSLR